MALNVWEAERLDRVQRSTRTEALAAARMYYTTRTDPKEINRTMQNMDDNSTNDFVEAQQRKREILDSYSIEELRAEVERRDADMDRIADKLADRLFERLGLDDDTDDDQTTGARSGRNTRRIGSIGDRSK